MHNKQIKKGMIYFISGHIDVSEDDFVKHYKEQIDKALLDKDCSFVIGDADGIDTMAQKYLYGKIDKTKVTVYHSRDMPRNNPMGYPMKGGYKDYTEKDAVMTANSDVDILWIRSAEETKKLYGDKYRASRISGTEKNKLRRQSSQSSLSS